ncbi:MAG TPA: serine hydrolase domain-containing protein [Kofleriaceae bacterium]|nr:serine hydrolase domain-containing protein [Kofleriaceae bacterium]
MRPSLVVALVLAACGPSSLGPTKKPAAATSDREPHKAKVAALIQPLIDADYATGIVVGLYEGGRTEVYGFGKGPGNRAPDASTLFEIGSVTKVFTALMLADSVQRQEVALETNLADLLPPGVTVPTKDKRTITLGMLAMHTSGLPRLPPSMVHREDVPDPYAKYGEEQLYEDLNRTPLLATPGDKVVYSNFGMGVLGFVLGRKLGSSYAVALEGRVLQPLGLGSTFLKVPDAAKVRRATGTNPDLRPVPYWYFDALAGAGGLVSDAHDMLSLIDDEMDAASSSRGPMRQAMKLTQAPQLERPEGDNEGLGWEIDSAGRFWHNGQTGGFHVFVGFEPKTRRGVVLLASTALAIFDRFADELYQMMAGEDVKPFVPPTADQLATYAGTYSLQDEPLAVTVKGKRLYITGRGAPPYRMIPLNDHEMWIEQLQAIVNFQKSGNAIGRAVFFVGDQQLIANRVPDATGSGSGSAAH